MSLMLTELTNTDRSAYHAPPPCNPDKDNSDRAGVIAVHSSEALRCLTLMWGHLCLMRPKSCLQFCPDVCRSSDEDFRLVTLLTGMDSAMLT